MAEDQQGLMSLLEDVEDGNDVEGGEGEVKAVKDSSGWFTIVKGMQILLKCQKVPGWLRQVEDCGGM